MKRKKISSRITASLVLVNTIYTTAILALIWSYSLSNGRLNNMNMEATQPAIIINEIQDAILQERIGLRQLALLESGTGEFAAELDVLEENHQKVLSAIIQYRDVLSDESNKAAASEFLEYYTSEYRPLAETFIRLSAENSDSDALKALSSVAEAEVNIDSKLDGFSSAVDDSVTFFLADAKFGFVRLIVIAVVLEAVVMIVVVNIIRYMKRLISKRIEKLSKTAELLSMGILDVEVKDEGTDEIAQLADSLLSMVNSNKTQVEALVSIADGDLTVNVVPRCDSDIMGNAILKMLNNLSGMFSDVNTATDQVSGGARQIADGAQALASGSTQQAATVDELSTSIAQVLIQTRENAQNAAATQSLVNQAGVEMQDTLKYMEDLGDTVSGISSSSEKISKVIKVIDDIAFQTNILALNAAVEAARAGQHGKGFAVVAEEVRNLASKSAKAAKETADLVQTSLEYVHKGNEMTDKTNQSVMQVANTAQQAQERIHEINEASRSQENAIARINLGIEQISGVVQTNSATAEENAAASEELSRQSQILRQLVEQFRIKDSNYPAALSSTPASRGQLFDGPQKTDFALSEGKDAYGKY